MQSRTFTAFGPTGVTRKENYLRCIESLVGDRSQIFSLVHYPMENIGSNVNHGSCLVSHIRYGLLGSVLLWKNLRKGHITEEGTEFMRPKGRVIRLAEKGAALM